jgi:uncharacterized protein with FMN-binding domain
MRLFARAAIFGTSITAICAAAAAFSPEAAQSRQAAPTAKKVAEAPVSGSATVAAFARGASPVRVVAYVQRYRDGRSTGPAVDAYYGVVQVQAVIRGGRVVAVNVLRHPSHSWTSRSINSRALPRLEQEVISAQSADVHAVSGATLTSDAFVRSMNEALRQASV